MSLYYKVQQRLAQEIPAGPYYLFALLIAFFYIFSVFPFNYFTGESGFWFDVRSDPTQHITGLWAFINDSWHFPLLYTQNINYPEGESIAYTDSIPIAALIYKLIHPLFNEQSHYFGFWTALSFVFNALAASYFVGESTRRTIPVLISASLLALMMPALMIRLPHTALLSQFVIILSLAFYYLGTSGKMTAEKALYMQMAVIILTVFIHPYLFAMVFSPFLLSP